MVLRSLRVFIKTHKPSIVFLSELKTYSSSSFKIQKILLSLGFPSFDFVPAIGKVGGIALYWKSVVNLQVVFSNPNMINAMIFFEPSHTPGQLTSVYGPTIQSLKTVFWDSLFEIDNSWKVSWCLLSDFNSLLDQMDKKGGRQVAQTSAIGFCGFVQECGLIDIGFTRAQYTWNKK